MPDAVPVPIDFDSWLRLGVEAGWVTPQFCLSRDGFPLTVDEEASGVEDDPDFFDRCRFALFVIPAGERVGAFPGRWRDPLDQVEPLPPEVAAGVAIVDGNVVPG